MLSFVKAPGVTAAFTERLHGDAAGKALVNRPRPVSCKDFIQALAKEIPQGDVPLVIQAAGHHRPVRQHADLIPQAVAKAPIRQPLQ